MTSPTPCLDGGRCQTLKFKGVQPDYYYVRSGQQKLLYNTNIAPETYKTLKTQSSVSGEIAISADPVLAIAEVYPSSRGLRVSCPVSIVTVNLFHASCSYVATNTEQHATSSIRPPAASRPRPTRGLWPLPSWGL